MLPFRRNRQVIKTDKHEVTFTQLQTDTSTTKDIQIALGVDVGDKNASTECAVGSHIPWIYCEINFSAEIITVPKTIHWTIRVVPPNQTESVPSNFYAIDRSYVLKRGMEMLPKDVSVVYKRIFTVKIPRIYSRVKDGQVIQFSYVTSSAEATNVCGIFVYKERYWLIRQ